VSPPFGIKVVDFHWDTVPVDARVADPLHGLLPPPEAQQPAGRRGLEPAGREALQASTCPAGVQRCRRGTAALPGTDPTAREEGVLHVVNSVIDEEHDDEVETGRSPPEGEQAREG